MKEWHGRENECGGKQSCYAGCVYRPIKRYRFASDEWAKRKEEGGGQGHARARAVPEWAQQWKPERFMIACASSSTVSVTHHWNTNGSSITNSATHGSTRKVLSTQWECAAEPHGHGHAVEEVGRSGVRSKRD